VKYTIEDEEAQSPTTIEADDPREALELYVRNECHDVDDGDEVNVEITDETGARFDGTAEIEDVREVHCLVMPKRIKKGA